MGLSDAVIEALTGAIRQVAADEILPRFRNLDESDVAAKSHAHDLVTIADQRAERAMTARFQEILPDAVIIGEEAISEGIASLEAVGAGRCVVIDPIDGTWNFAHGIANYGVLVSVIEEGQTVWGCCYDPTFDDWVSASKGGGAWFHRGGAVRRLRTAQEADGLGQLRGNIGEVYMPQAHRSRIAPLVADLGRHNSLGASVMEYRQMALAGSDFCLNPHLNVWDHAAGALCLAEAGGVNRLLDGRAYAPGMSAADLGDGAYLLNARSEAVWDIMAEAVRGLLGQD